MPRKPKSKAANLSVVRSKAESRTLSVGPLRSTPVGKLTQDQLESSRHLVAATLKELERAADETTLERLEADLRAVEEELERREFDLGAA